VSRQSSWEYLRVIYPRYRQASREDKRRILDEFCQVTHYHRKSALRLLNGPPPERTPPPRRPRPPHYGPKVLRVLRAVWEAAGYPWSLRLKALLPLWLPWAQHRFRLSPALSQQLLALSPRQMDRRLQPYKRQLRRRLYGRTKPGTLLKHQIPLRTDRWDVTVPGWSETDLVSHTGNCGDGECLHSLNLTDILTTWVETHAVMGKSQVRVCAALDELRRALPFRLLGIDSDNGSEFINAHLVRYCQKQEIQFTRGRPYKKDDNAHIEQKNWTHVRKLLGYVRYDSPQALALINELYRHELRLLQNLFLPSVKLVQKTRVGSRVRRVYDRPQTPLQRVLACPEADPAKVAQLIALRDNLDPFQLAQAVQQKLERIYDLASPGPGRKRPAIPEKSIQGGKPLHPILTLKYTVPLSVPQPPQTPTRKVTS
jgi:hypothetical protein